MYQKGEGTYQDTSEAKTWLTKAATQGHQRAKERLSKLNETTMAQPHAQQNGTTGGVYYTERSADSSPLLGPRTPAPARTPATTQPATTQPAPLPPTFAYNTDSARVFRTIQGTPTFTFARVECMDGDMAITQENKQGVFRTAPNAQVGEVCRLQLQYSADTHADPAKRAARPDSDLLAPYRDIARDKGYVANDESARHLVRAYNNLASTPEAMSAKEPIRVTLKLKTDTQETADTQKTIELVVAPGVALDAGFTAAMLAFYEDGIQPKRSFDEAMVRFYEEKNTPTSKRHLLSNDELTKMAEHCNRNDGVLSVGSCRLLGEQMAAKYVQRGKK